VLCCAVLCCQTGTYVVLEPVGICMHLQNVRVRHGPKLPCRAACRCYTDTRKFNNGKTFYVYFFVLKVLVGATAQRRGKRYAYDEKETKRESKTVAQGAQLLVQQASGFNSTAGKEWLAAAQTSPRACRMRPDFTAVLILWQPLLCSDSAVAPCATMACRY
jgi:hypothetical protein